jgi:hypothetical protein
MTTGPSLRARRPTVAGLLAAAVIACGARGSAHRLDEFLQAARIAIAPDRVQLEIDLTPGISVADSVIAAIDGDRNGVLSRDEQQGYAGRVLTALTLSIDDSTPLAIQLASASVPDPAALRSGDAAIIIRAEAAVSPLPAGLHRLLFRNRHASANSVYLANALVPDSDQVAVTDQQRDGDQRELTIGFVVTGAATGFSRYWPWIVLVVALALTVLLTPPRGARVKRHLRQPATPLM